MPATIETLQYTGGLNTRATNFNCPKDALTACTNLRIRGNSLVERGGSLKVNSSPVSGNCNILNFAPTSTYVFNEVAVFGNRIYKVSGSSLSAIDGGSSIYAGSTGAAMAQANLDTLNGVTIIGDIITNGNLAKWTGTGNATAFSGGNIPDGQLVKTVNNFMFVAGGGATFTNPSRVTWSNVGDATTWTAGNSIEFRFGDGDFITALSYIGTDLYIFKTNSVGRLSTNTIIVSGAVTLGPLTTALIGIGCPYGNGVVRLPDGRLVFIGSNNHIYLYDGSTAFDISDQPWPRSNIQAILDGINFLTAGVYPAKNEVWITGGAVNGTFTIGCIYNYVDNIWYKFTTAGSYSAMLWNPFNIQFHAGDNAGTIWQEDQAGSQDQGGTNIDCTFTKSLLFAAEARTNIPRSLQMYIQNGSAGTSGSVTFSTGYDGGSTATAKTQTALAASATKRIVTPFPVSATASSLQIVVDNPAQNGFTYNPITVSDEVMI